VFCAFFALLLLQLLGFFFIIIIIRFWAASVVSTAVYARRTLYSCYNRCEEARVQRRDTTR
jgi:hypothetical protein